MFQHFCTRVARKMRRIGYAKKAAIRFARTCYLLMLTACGLMGLFLIFPAELHGSVAIAGTGTAGSRGGFFSPALFSKRR